MNNNTTADTKQCSREDGPITVIDQLIEERESLVAEKQRIESLLSQAECNRLDALRKMYRQKLPKSKAIQTSCGIESSNRTQRAELIRSKTAIEERLSDVKKRLIELRQKEDANKPKERSEVFERIEKLLIEIRDRLPQ